MTWSAKIILVAACLVLAACSGSGKAESESEREEAFKELLGFMPPPSVSGIESSWDFQRDTYNRLLRFSCDDEVIGRLKRFDQNREHFKSPNSGPGRGINPNLPDWWSNVVLSSPLECEVDYSDSSETKVVHVWIDEKNRTVYAAREVFH